MYDLIDKILFVTFIKSETNQMVHEKIQQSAARVATHCSIKTNNQVIYDSLGLEFVQVRGWKQIDSYLKKAFQLQRFDFKSFNEPYLT